MRWVSKGSRAARRRRQQRGGRRTRAPTPMGGSEQAQEALTRTEGNPEAEGPPSPTRPRSGPRQGACATSLAGPRSPLLQVPPLTPGLASASAAGESGESRTRAATRVRGRTLPTPQHLCAGDTPTAAAGGARFSHFRDGCRAREGAQAACARRPAQAQPPGGGAGTQDARPGLVGGGTRWVRRAARRLSSLTHVPVRYAEGLWPRLPPGAIRSRRRTGVREGPWQPSPSEPQRAHCPSL